ncbi:hypothetical protein EC912_10540 [Luteibacter rhizovicinus]|uniref:Uncharacterized protein n=1 Tax=Luteibacter rhizovicinus TaxID=242606 RepID=A0A4R3YLP1_9GAMM|nr:hypothetical protein [Luteibacter rhizovicinus]TCV93180.1 hypothetical protein EC912_10540 [Luteibacter rhizovicinus]
MRNWKTFIPQRQDLETLAKLPPGKLFISSQNKPAWNKVYIQVTEGKWLSLSWDYVDVEFKFEIYCLSIAQHATPSADDFIQAGEIPDFSSIRFLLKSEWVRPASSNEVPDNFEQVIEESGLAADVPRSASAVGTSLHGIVFIRHDGKPCLLVEIDESQSYSIRTVENCEAIAALTSKYDSLSFSEVLAWHPQSGEAS